MSEEFINLTIELLSASERKAIFKRTCELLSVNIDKEAQKLKLERKREGYEPSASDLISFCGVNGLHGQFDFRGDQKLFQIFVPRIPAKGKVVIDAPQTIKPTSVDQVIVDEAPDIILTAAEPVAAENKDWRSVAMGAPLTEEEAGIDDSPVDEDEESDPF